MNKYVSKEAAFGFGLSGLDSETTPMANTTKLVVNCSSSWKCDTQQRDDNDVTGRTTHTSQAASSVGVKKVRDRKLKFSDRGDYGCSQFQLNPNFRKIGDFQLEILYYWKTIF